MLRGHCPLLTIKSTLAIAALLLPSIEGAAAPLAANRPLRLTPEVHVAQADSASPQRSGIEFLQAYLAQDEQALTRLITDDCIFLFAVSASDTYIGVTPDVVTATWDHSTGGLLKRGQITDAWLFPTGDPNTLFLSYRERAENSVDGTPSGPREHLAILELRDTKVVRFRELTGRLPQGLEGAIRPFQLGDRQAHSRQPSTAPDS